MAPPVERAALRVDFLGIGDETPDQALDDEKLLPTYPTNKKGAIARTFLTLQIDNYGL